MFGDLPPYEASPIGGVNSVRGYPEGGIGTGRHFVVASGELRLPVPVKEGGVQVPSGIPSWHSICLRGGLKPSVIKCWLMLPEVHACCKHASGMLTGSRRATFLANGADMIGGVHGP